MRFALPLLVAVVAGILPCTATAACINPGGGAGDQIYNSDHSVMQYCNGTAWISMAGGGGGVSDGDKGDITVSGSGAAWAIDDGAVTIPKLSITGTPDGNKFLRDDGTWAAVSGTLSDGDKGSITVSSSGAAWTIDAGAVTNAMLAGSIALSKLSITGTPDGSKFLKDDGTWATPSSSSQWSNGASSAIYYNSGKVGIGTASPAQKLEVYNGEIVINMPSASDYSAIDFNNAGTRKAYISYGANEKLLYVIAEAASSQLVLSTANTERLRIDASGNVGIGTTDPKRNLHINAAASEASLLFSRADGLANNKIWRIFSNNSGAGTAGSLQFDLLNDATSGVTTSVMTMLNSGNVGIGVTNPDAGLGTTSGFSFLPTPAGSYLTIGHPAGVSAGQPWLAFSYNGSAIGSVTQNSTTGTSYNTASDRRVKENLGATREGLARLMQIDVQDFNFIADPSKTRVQGFIAQDLYKVYPAAVTVGGEDAKTAPWAVDYGRITPLLVKSIQELKADNDNLRRDFEAYKAAHP